jgi:histidinol-phosphate aminotransferase
MKIRGYGDGVSRRSFLGTITGAAALTLMNLDRRAFADTDPSAKMLNDYTGRLCYNENPLGPSPAAITAIREQATLAHRYPDWYAESLAALIASRYSVSTDKVICGCGGTEMLRLCAMVFSRPGRNVIVPYPSYSQFPSDAQYFGSSVRYVNLDRSYRADLPAMLSRVDSNTTAICLTNPNNPTATIVNSQDLVDFVNALRSDIVTVIDEAYLDYISGEYPSAIELVRNNKNVVVIKTFSKVYGLAGARIGFAVGKSSAITSMRNAQIFATVSRPSLEASKAALDDHQHIQRTVDLANHAKDLCYINFQNWGLDCIPSETSFFMVDVGTNADTVRSQLEAHGIYVRTGWGMPNHLRVSTGTMEETNKFLTVLYNILNGPGPHPDPESARPMMLQLNQAIPNPFNSTTRISLFLPAAAFTSLEIFDIQGRLVKRLAAGPFEAGDHSFLWDGTNQNKNTVATGAYFYRLAVGDKVMTRRMLFIK